MRTFDEWAEDRWDVIAVAAVFVLALGIAFNVLATRPEPPSRPAGVEIGGVVTAGPAPVGAAAPPS